MFRKSKAIIICITALLVFISSFSMGFESKASDTHTFHVNYSEPAVTDAAGYLSVIFENNGSYFLDTFVWCIDADSGPNSGEGQTSLRVDLGSNRIWFQCFATDSNSMGNWSLYYYGANKFVRLYGKTGFINADEYTYGHSGYKTVGFICNGSAFVTNSTGSSSLLVPRIVWGSDNVIVDALGSLSVIVGDLKTLEQEENQLVDENNTWLEKIFDLLQDSPDQEKDVATSQGQQSTNDITNSIEDKSQGFIDSIGGLVNSVSHQNTGATWTFPAITLPAIPGVMPSYQLTSQQTIDFTFWVNQIPNNIMIIVRSVLTIGLIVYCFKEFYGVIEYVLTMRGGGNNE